MSINCIYTRPGTWIRLAHGPELLLLDEAEAPAQAPEALHHEAEVAGHHRAREGDVLGDPGTLDITCSPRYMLQISPVTWLDTLSRLEVVVLILAQAAARVLE